MKKWDWDQKWACLSFMVHVVKKWVLWPQGPWWMQAKLNQALHDNTHIQLCIGEGPFHVHSWQDQRWQMFSTKTRTCHSYKVNHDTVLESSSTLAYLAKEKKNYQHNQFFAYTVDELYFAVHVFYIAFLAEYSFCQVKYDA